MIDIKTKIHDRFSIELKMGFLADDTTRQKDFTVGMWIFVPESLDITPTTFTKAEFYRAVKTNVRLKTPRFRLGEIVEGEARPLRNVLEAPEGELDYRLKLFAAIVSGALRDTLDELRATTPKEREAHSLAAIAYCEGILDHYYQLPDGRMHAYCGEFICNRVARSLFKMLDMGAPEGEAKRLLRRIYDIREQRGYAQMEPNDPARNSTYLHRQSVLKKMVESQLYLRAPKKRDGVLAEQALYSIAAGMAMLFATVVAWAFQRTFGNLTWPLFLALVISYMMKDRIKELMRFYFNHRLSTRYYDHKANMSIHGQIIGWIKEAMDFMPGDRIPADVEAHRNAVHLFSAEEDNIRENVILYRKRVFLDKDRMEANSLYEYDGINDIVRIQVRPFLRKMDNPTLDVQVLDDAGNVMTVACDRDYYINLVVQYESGDAETFKRFRIALNRDGVKSIEPVL